MTWYRTLRILCIGWLLAGSAWAAPAPSSAPLVEPRATTPDSVRALQRARADSLRAHQPHMSGGQALAVGLGLTLAPPAIALLTNPPGSDSEFAWEASLTIGAALGIYAGPAVGLSSGGRGDMAAHGIKLRSIGYGAMLIGLIGVGSAYDNGSGGVGTVIVGSIGLAGAVLAVGSCIYDLSVTPSAVGPARRVSVRPMVDAEGRLGLRATF